MIETTDSNIHPVDSLIERTLARDAEQTRNRFAAVPNAQLTAKLALSTASRGLLSGLGAKLALYAGGALLVGGAVYFIPSLSQQSPKTIAPAMPVVRSAAPAVQHSSTTVSLPSKSGIAVKSVTPQPVSAGSRPSVLKLDEADSKNIPHITDPKYQPPLK